jgi:protein-tyrosine-phosphatase
MASILFVCTANICRSPYAAAAVSAALGSDSRHTVVSAGARTDWLDLEGEPACEFMPVPPNVESVAQHAAQQLTAQLVHDADLIVAFESAHRSAVLDLVPRAQTKTYAATQIERLARAVATEHGPATAPTPSGDPLRDLNAARSWAPFTEDQDISDPHGGGTEAHEACAKEIDGIVSALLRVLI